MTNRKLKRKRKQKRNGWGHLRGGASRPSRRLPRFLFCFRFHFNFRFFKFWILKYYEDVVKMLWKCCENVVKILWKCCENVAKMFWKYCENVAKMLWKCCENVVKMLWKCCENVVKMFWKCCANVNENMLTLLSVREHILILFIEKCEKYYVSNVLGISIIYICTFVHM